MAEIGTAYVSLIPSAAGFGAKASTELGGVGKPAGETASKGFRSSFVKGMAGMGATMASFFAFEKVKDFVTESVSAARDFQKLTGITAQVIKTTHGAANVTTEDIKKMAEEISKQTGASDESVLSGENMLLTFRGIRNEVGKGNDIFNQASGSVMDLAAAMAGGGRGAAGANPKTAAIQLGKALNDPIKGVTALARVGIQFNDQQKKQIKSMVDSGHLMGAQKIILKELHTEFGGAGAAGATAGERAKAAFGRLQVQLGTYLLPVLDKVETWLSTKLLPAVQQFVDDFAKGKGSAGDLRDAITGLWKAFMKLWPILLAVGKWLGDHIKVIEAVVVAYIAWQLATMAYNVVQAVQLVLLMAVTPGTLAYAVAQGVATVATWLFEGATAALVITIGLVVLAIIALVVVVILIVKYHRQIGAFIVMVWGKIKSAIGAAVSWVVAFVKKHWGLLVTIIGGPLGAVLVLIIKNWGKIKTFIGRALVAIGQVVRAGWAHVTGFISDAGTALVNAVKSIPGRLRALGGLFADAGRWIITAFVNGLKNAGGIITGIAGNVWDALRGLINGAIDHLNSLLEFSIKVGPKSFTINPPDISHLATGGRAKGSVVEVGDGNRWESIIPDRLMVDALTAAATAGQGMGPGREPRSLRLVVDGYEFNAYVDDRADERVANAGAMDAQRGRAAWR